MRIRLLLLFVLIAFASIAQNNGVKIALLKYSGGGDWYAVVREGACTVEAGIHDKPTTTLKMSDEDFLKYVSGQLPAMQAYSSGKLKIEGDLMKSQLVEKLFKF